MLLLKTNKQKLRHIGKTPQFPSKCTPPFRIFSSLILLHSVPSGTVQAPLQFLLTVSVWFPPPAAVLLELYILPGLLSIHAHIPKAAPVPY